MQVWHALAINIATPENNEDLNIWLREVVTKSGNLPIVALWVIWLSRNKASFDHIIEPVNTVVAHV